MSRPHFLNVIKSKLLEPAQLELIKNKHHFFGRKIVFTNGCFDLMHRGHIEYLAQAAQLGSFLIVGLNTDSSVKRQNKSPERPIHNEETRALQLGSLLFVDAIVLFDEETPYELIKKIEPDVLVKGADYDASETDPKSKKYIAGSDIVRSKGGEVITIPIVEGYSTTNILEKLRK